MGVFIY